MLSGRDGPTGARRGLARGQGKAMDHCIVSWTVYRGGEVDGLLSCCTKYKCAEGCYAKAALLVLEREEERQQTI